MKRSREPEEPEEARIPEHNLDAFAEASVSKSDDPGLPAAKLAELDPEDFQEGVAMRCHLPPHKEALAFPTYDDFETHYGKAHTNRCLECGKNFPSGHFLSLHIEDCHDPLVAVRREKGDRTYSCFVEDCDRKCRTTQKRRMHLIDKHTYPKNFFFAITKAGIDGRHSLLVVAKHRRNRSSTSTTTAKDSPQQKQLPQTGRQKLGTDESGVDAGGDGPSLMLVDTDRPAASEDSPEESKATEGEPPEPVDTEMDDLAGAVAAMKFVPPSIRFGRGRGRTGFARE